MSKVDKDSSKKVNAEESTAEKAGTELPSVDSILDEVKKAKEKIPAQDSIPDSKEGILVEEPLVEEDHIVEEDPTKQSSAKQSGAKAKGTKHSRFISLRKASTPRDSKGNVKASSKPVGFGEKLFVICGGIAIFIVVALVVLIIGGAIAYEFVSDDFSLDPAEESSITVKMDSMYFEYIQESPFVPNDGFSHVVYEAQLFSASDYYVYVTDESGEVYHASITQCKLVRNDEDLNTVTVKYLKGISHPFMLFNMDDTEFSDNVSPLFMPGFSDGMVNFVYQYLAETLPLEELPENN